VITRARRDKVPALHALRADAPPTSGILAVAAALFACSLSVFILIADDLLDGGGLISHDQAVLSWFVGVRTDAWVFVAKVFSALGSFVGLAILSLLLAFFLRVRSWQWELALAPLVSLLVATLASIGAKALFGRARPPVTLHAATVTSAAFPSGHATDAAACLLAGSFVLALTVAAHRRGQLLWPLAGLVGAGLIGLSRLILAVHWLSDVVAGWALGTAIAIMVVVASWHWVTRALRSNDADA
jgi:membrane-associated phospholipid phosphatase